MIRVELNAEQRDELRRRGHELDISPRTRDRLEKVAALPPVLPEGYCRERPCVIALDNYSVHHSQLVKDRMPTLEGAGVRFFFLPPYSPEMNAIEPLWRQVKYQDLPERSYKTAQALQAAVDEALTNRADRLKRTTPCPETDTFLRRCA